MEPRSYRSLWLIVTGALLGGFSSAWLSPKVIEWWYTPPAMPGMLNCVEPVRWALHKLQIAQLGGIVAGALVGLAIAIALAMRSRRHAEPMMPQR